MAKNAWGNPHAPDALTKSLENSAFWAFSR